MNKTVFIPIIPKKYRWIFSNSYIEELFIYGNTDSCFKDKLIFRTRYIIFIYICIETLFRFLLYFVKQFFIPVVLNKEKVLSIILESGKGYGCSNIYKIFDINQKVNISIKAFHLKDYMKLGRVDAFLFGKNILSAILDYYTTLSFNFSDKVISLSLKQGASYITRYSYMKTQFFLLHKKYPDCVVYTDSGSIPSHASISAGFKTIHLYHGLMSHIHPNTFPDYYSIYVYSKDEKEYLLKVGVDSEVYIYPSIALKFKTNSVIFFMPADISNNLNLDTVLKELVELFNLFERYSYKIFIKLHPLCYVNNSFSKEYKLSYTNWYEALDFIKNYNLIDEDNASVALSKLKPSFLVGLHGSTVLCEGLNLGIIPIGIFKPDKKILDSVAYRDPHVYKINERSLSWPLDLEIINSVLGEKKSYAYGNIIRKLCCNPPKN